MDAMVRITEAQLELLIEVVGTPVSAEWYAVHQGELVNISQTLVQALIDLTVPKPVVANTVLHIQSATCDNGFQVEHVLKNGVHSVFILTPMHPDYQELDFAHTLDEETACREFLTRVIWHNTEAVTP